jgi:twitching motility protein PilT
MAQFDRFVQTLYKFRADQLTAASGERVILYFGSDRKAVSADSATRQQLEGLLKEIVPSHLAPRLSQEGEHEFGYESPAGPVRVQVQRQGTLLRILAFPGAFDAASSPSSATGSSDALREPTTGPAPGVTKATDAFEEDSEALDSDSDPGEPEPPASGGPLGGTPSLHRGPGAAVPGSVPLAQASPRLGAGIPSSPRAVQAMELLLRKMVEGGCSDLHLSSGNPPLFRKDGQIVPLGDAIASSSNQLHELLFSIAPPGNRSKFEASHDTDFAYEVKGLARFRCNLFMDRLGIGVVFRVIPTKIPSVEDLGLPKHILQLCRLNKGLVLVTGPTGCGKSTTLAAMIDWINKNRTDHIITIEDPIEFVHENQKCLVNQREVGTHTEGFKQALRAALREDPDIVLVGEMRDLETVAIAIETAETGHLVFGTLHTNTAPSTVDRIIDQFPADRQSQIRTMLSESLKGVISQTLCKRKGAGRVAALEILYVTGAISNLIREGKTFQIPSLMQTNKAMGMTMLNDALLDLVHKGLVEPQEAYFKSMAKTEFKSLLERNNFKVEAV